ncbi:MAG: RNA-binding S4 domain-containing protein [Acidithiobacillus sp.]|nr:RNA-binding S4 domain-containing protein [Acidithiobacillus sp.]
MTESSGLRLDLFLKMSRLIKRRSIAKEICDGGRVRINGRLAKASSEIHVGDLVEIDLRERCLRARVERLPKRVEGPEGIVQFMTEGEIS